MKSLISRDKKYCGGMPRIRGTRITSACIKYWSEVYTPKEIHKMYPHVTIEQITVAINYGRKTKNYSP